MRFNNNKDGRRTTDATYERNSICKPETTPHSWQHEPENDNYTIM